MIGIPPPAGIGEGHIILHVEAVADMAVDIEDGVEPLQERDHRAGFGSIRLRIVAVQIDVAGIADIAFFQRAAQGWEVPAAHPFMPVDIINRHEDQVDLVQQAVLAA